MGGLSNLCRLCAVKLESGFDIFLESEDRASLVILINKYLPIKVAEDDILPKQICESCHLGVATAVDLIDRMVEGQQKLRIFWNQAKKTFNIKKPSEKDSEIQISAPHEIDARLLKKEIHPTLIDIQGNMPDIEMNDLAKGVNIKKIYETHPLSHTLQSFPTKRKRGRPKKGEEVNRQKKSPEVLEFSDQRPRRKVNVPSRFRDGLIENNVASDEFTMDEDFSDQLLCKEMNTTLEGNSVTVTSNNLSVLSKLPATVNIELDFPDGEDHTLNKISSLNDFVPLPKASVYQVEMLSPDQLSQSKSAGRKAKQKFKWNCDLCEKYFLHKGRYIFHMNLHKNVIMQCLHCGDGFCMREDITIHQKNTNHKGVSLIETDKRLVDKHCIKCPFCKDIQFTSLDTYNTHMVTNHEKEKPFSCTICKKRFVHRQNLKNHYVCHEPMNNTHNFPCEICGRIFQYHSSLIYHRETKHNHTRNFPCTMCEATFKHKQILQRHIASVHSIIRPFSCTICLKEFKTRSHLNNHMNIHNVEKKYECQICGGKFNYAASLHIHKKRHVGGKPYHCTVCGKFFFQKGNLKEHVRIHTGEKPYKCNFCLKMFTTSSQVRMHERVHLAANQFTCQFCTKSFLKEKAWLKHMKTHRTCNICSKRFLNEVILSEHMKTHKGTLPSAIEINVRSMEEESSQSDKEPKSTKFVIPPNANDMLSFDTNLIYIIPNKKEEMSFTEEMFQNDQSASCSKEVLSRQDSNNLQTSFVVPSLKEEETVKPLAGPDLRVEASQTFDTKNGNILSVLPNNEYLFKK